MLLTFTKPKFEGLIKENIKQHTIRADKNNRWKVGNSIQFWNGNPRNVHAKNKPRQFGTGICCKVVPIHIYPNNDAIICDGYGLSISEIESLAINDGFESWAEMKTFFTEDFVGKMIFWEDCVWS
jgi:hypothetical protein